MFYDVVVIGGGPAGMMAAGRAAELGAKTALLEKNKTLGRKLLITGKGRSNIAQAEFDLRKLAEKYGREGDFFLYSLSVFGPKETINFFEKRGLSIKTERGRRIFPKSDNSGDVLKILINYLKSGRAEIMTDWIVKEIVSGGNGISKIIIENGRTSGVRPLLAKNYIITTGGLAFPGTGSTGDGYKWAEKFGHRVSKLRPALVPIRIKEDWPKRAQGLSLKNIELSVFQKGRKKDQRFGEMLFTHFGISGPIVLDLSKTVGELLERDEVKLSIDLKPALNFQILDKRIQNDFAKYSKKLFKNSLSDLLPQKLIPIFIELSGINPSREVNGITREERHKIVRLLKSLEMTVSGVLGFERAIVTSGGVAAREIDAKTMKSKIISNLFFAGEIIDLHGPTGGYNLQQSWTTGYLAGQSAAKL